MTLLIGFGGSSAASTAAVRERSAGNANGEPVETYATFGGKRLIDPGLLYDYAMEQGTPLDFWKRANSYSCPTGKDPGVGWILLQKSDLDDLDKNELHALKWHDGKRTLNIPSLMIVRSTCMTSSTAGDEDAVHLVELADKRRSMRGVVNQAYNLRIPVVSGDPETASADLYYDESLESSAIMWTWKKMLDDIWDDLPAIAGDAPSLPYAPDGYPEGFRFHGVAALDAYHAVLDRLHCVLAYDPILDTFSIKSIGATQEGLDSTLDRLAADGRRVFDTDPLGTQAAARANVPVTVRVFFRRTHEFYDLNNWPSLTSAFNYQDLDEIWGWYHVNVASNIDDAENGSVVALFDDLPALMNISGSSTPDNLTEITARANERATKYIASIYDRDSHHYAGAVSVVKPGARVSTVTWRDYGETRGDGSRLGLITEIVNEQRDTKAAIERSDKYLARAEPRQAPGVMFCLKQAAGETLSASTVSIELSNSHSDRIGFGVRAYGDLNAYTPTIDGFSINEAGRYSVTLSTTVYRSIESTQVWIEYDPSGTGSYGLIGQILFVERRYSGIGYQTASMTTLIDAKAGGAFRVRMVADAGAGGLVYDTEVVFVRATDPRLAVR